MTTSCSSTTAPKYSKRCSHSKEIGHTKPTCPAILISGKKLVLETSAPKRRNVVQSESSSNVDNDGAFDSDGELVDDNNETIAQRHQMAVEDDDEDELGSIFEAFNVDISDPEIVKGMCLRSGFEPNEVQTTIPKFDPPAKHKLGPQFYRTVPNCPREYVKLYWNDEIMDTVVVAQNVSLISSLKFNLTDCRGQFGSVR
jgi:hypothetical protein